MPGEGERCLRRSSPDSDAAAKVSPSKGTTKRKGKNKDKDKTVTKDMIEKKIMELAEKPETTEAPSKPKGPVINNPDIPKDLQTKFISQTNQTLKLEEDLKDLTNKLKLIESEKDAINVETQQAIERKDRMEDLCRKLQDQNKTILDDVKARGEKEQDARKGLSDEFSEKIKQITANMETQAQERLGIAQDNDKLRQKIEDMRNVIIKEEEDFNKKNKAKEKEVKKVHDKIADVDAKLRDEKKKFEEYREKIEGGSSTAEALRLQLQLYSGRFETFQTTLQKSNPVFSLYKAEMDSMGKKMRELDGENQNLKLKIVKAEYAILEMLMEKAKIMKRAPLISQQNAELQALCKDLNAERAELKGKLGK